MNKVLWPYSRTVYACDKHLSIQQQLARDSKQEITIEPAENPDAKCKMCEILEAK